jgi:membrane associated rhomboid family serine protease
MKNRIVAGIAFIVVFAVVIVPLVMWFAFSDIIGDQSIAGLSGAVGGALGGVLVAIYLSSGSDKDEE